MNIDLTQDAGVVEAVDLTQIEQAQPTMLEKSFSNGSAFARPAAYAIIQSDDPNEYDVLFTEIKTKAETFPAQAVIQEVADKVKADQKTLLQEALDQYSAAGDVATTAGIVKGLNTFDKDWPTHALHQTNKINEAAMEKLVASNPSVLKNNSADKLNKHITKSAEAYSWNLFLDYLAETHRPKGFDIAKSVGRDVLPFAYQFSQYSRIPSIYKAYASNDSALYGKDLLEDIHNKLSIMELNDRKQFINGLIKLLSDSMFVTKVDVAEFVHNIVNGLTYQKENINQALDATFTALDATTLAAPLRWIRSKNLAKTLTENGNKGTVGDTVAKALLNGADEQAAKELGMTVDELRSAGLSFDPKQFVPHAVEGLAPDIQKALLKETESLIDKISNTLRTTGKTQPEIEEAVARIKKQFDPAVNPRIVSVDFASAGEAGVKSSIIWQSMYNKPFITREEAQAWADRTGKTNYEIIPATSQPSAVVSPKVLAQQNADLAAKVGDANQQHIPKPLQDAASLPDELRELYHAGWVFDKWANRLDSLEIEIDEAIVDAVRTNNKAALEDLYKVDKILNLLSDKVFFDLVGIFKHTPEDVVDALVNLQSIDELIKLIDDNPTFKTMFFDKEMAKISGIKTPPVQMQTVDEWVQDMVRGGVDGRIAISKSLPKNMLPLAEEFTKITGLDKQPLIIFSNTDAARLYKSGNNMLDAFIDYTKDTTMDAWWTKVDGVHYIYLPRQINSKNLSDVQLIENLAHEMGHMFHSTWVKKYDKLIANAYADWLYARNIRSKDDFYGLVLGDLNKFINDFRNFFSAGDILTQMQRRGVQSMTELNTAWYSMYQEFFAEQFAKWAITADAPKNALERAWKEIVTVIKELFQSILSGATIQKFVPAEQIITNMLNKHVAQIKAGKLKPKAVDYDSHFNLGNENVFEELLPGRVFAEDISGAVDINKYMASANEASAPSHGWYVRERRTDALSLDAVGKFTADDINSMHTVLGAVDPKHGASELLVAQRVIGVHAEALVRKGLVEFITGSYDKLSGAERQQVLGVLVKGDNVSNNGGVGKEYNYAELLAEGLNERQIDAYIKTRTVRNIMHNMRDQAMVNSLRSKGWQRTTIEMHSGEKFVSAGRKLEWEEVKSKAAFDTFTGERVVLTQQTIEDLQRRGHYVVETMEAWSNKGGRDYTRFVVRPSKVRTEQITTVIPYRQGEFARIYTDEYFIARRVDKEVNEEKVRVNDHLHTAKSAKEAEAYVAGMNTVLSKYGKGTVPVDIDDVSRLVGQWEDPAKIKQDIENGLWSNIQDFNWHFNRMKDDYVRDYTQAEAGAGRLFMDKRGAKLTPIDDADRENTLSVMDSIQAEVTNTARVVNLTEWKDAAIQRWYNTFADILPTEMAYMRPEQAFFAMEGKKYVGTSKQNLFAERTYKYVMEQLGAKTKEDKLWEGMSRAITERMFTGKLETIGAKLRQSEPLTFLRTINFHAMLGMFNVAQLFVQANGAGTAILLHPVHGTKAAFTAPLLRIALMSDNPEVWRTVASAEKLATLGMSSVREFEDTVVAIRRSGILDGIGSTSLYNFEDGRFNIFNKTARRVGEASAFFFNRGEEFTRLIGFDVARREWIKRNPGADWRTTEALREIVIRQDDLTQNMTRANQAAFQRGLLSVPLQFLQYNIKLGANLFGAVASKITGKPSRGFTAQEAATIFLGHLALYGLANNGFPAFLEEIFADATENLNEDQRLFFTQGIIAGVLNETGKALTGDQVQLAVGKRLSTFDWYGNVAKAVVNNEARTLETLMGPSYSILAGMGVVGQVSKVWWADPDMSVEDVIDGLRRISVENIATLRNIDKAYIAYNHGSKLQTRSGADSARVNQYELLAQAIGMPSAEVADLEKVMQNKQSHFDVLKNISKLINEQQVTYVTALNKGDNKRAEEILKTIRALYPTNSGDLDFVLRETRDSIYPYDTRLEKEISKYLQTKEFGMKEPFITNRDVRDNKVNRNGTTN